MEARFASVSGTKRHPRDERNTIFPQAVRKPDLCLGINSWRNLLATGRNVDNVGRNSISRRARARASFSRMNKIRLREREREDDIIKPWTVYGYDSNSSSSSPGALFRLARELVNYRNGRTRLTDSV